MSTIETHRIQTPPPGEIDSSIATLHPLENEGVFNSSEPLSERGIVRKAGAFVTYRVYNPDSTGSPKLAVPGFMATGLVYQPFAIAEAAISGDPVATVNPPRMEINPFVAFSPSRVLRAERLASQTVVAMIDTLTERYEQPIELYVHSMGGKSTTEALKAIDYRHRKLGGPPVTSLVRQVNYLASVGFEDTTDREVPYHRRVRTFLKDEMVPNRDLLRSKYPDKSRALVTRSMKHALLNPLRTSSEGLRIINYDMRTDVEMLSNQGVYTRALTFPADALVPEDAHLAKDVVHEYSSYPMSTAGHLFPQLYPEELTKYLVETKVDIKSSNIDIIRH